MFYMFHMWLCLLGTGRPCMQSARVIKHACCLREV